MAASATSGVWKYSSVTPETGFSVRSWHPAVTPRAASARPATVSLAICRMCVPGSEGEVGAEDEGAVARAAYVDLRAGAVPVADVEAVLRVPPVEAAGGGARVVG